MHQFYKKDKKLFGFGNKQHMVGGMESFLITSLVGSLRYVFSSFGHNRETIIFNRSWAWCCQAIALVASLVVGTLLWTKKKKSLAVISMSKVISLPVLLNVFWQIDTDPGMNLLASKIFNVTTLEFPLIKLIIGIFCGLKLIFFILIHN